MSYVISVGGDPINPNPYYYSQIELTASQTLIWPSVNQSSAYVGTNWVDITANAGGYIVTTPPADEAGTGAEIVFNNYGSFAITVNNASGGNITTVPSGSTIRIWITDNSTSAGTWRIANIGSGTTSANASMLAGYGLIAQAGQLSQAMQVTSFGTSATLNASYRSYLAKWTGGSGTFTLDSPVTLGNNWFVTVKNAGTGTLTVDGNGALIDGSATISAAVNEGFTITSDGAAFETTGRITPDTSGYTFLSKSVTGSTDITLNASEAVFNIIQYTGTLGASINVNTPTAVNEWVMYNSSTGSTYTLTIKTPSGTGEVLSQGVTRTLYCDGTNIRFSDDIQGAGTVTSIATGTGLNGGPITTAGTISLANTAVVAGIYGDSSTVPIINVNAQGQLIDVTTAVLSMPFTTGDVKLTFKTTPDSGWVMCDDGTIGSASSGATNRANADTANLFSLLWNNVSNTYAPVSGGRGVSATADFSANKTITLVATLGRVLAISGSGSGLTPRVLGQTLGEETHTMTLGELVSHTHTANVTDPGHTHLIKESGSGGTPGVDFGGGSGVTGNFINSATTGIAVTNTSSGSTTPFNVMQPTSFLNAMIKL